MRLLPLAVSAQAESWRLDPVEPPGGRAAAALDRDRRTCRFCGHPSGPWAEVFHLDGDHRNDAPDNLAAACPACHACQHLGRETADREYVVVLLPELSQAALTHLVRGIHLVFHRAGESPAFGAAPGADTPALRSAYTAYRELAARADAARATLGSASPRALGEALLGLPPGALHRAPHLVDGLRLLPLGRLFRGGADVYPDCLDAWDRAPQP